MSKVNPWKVTGYKPGQNVVCKVVGPEDDGYVVHVTKDNLAGYIRTPAPLRPGEEILAQFVCVHKNRLLLSPLMSDNSSIICINCSNEKIPQNAINTKPTVSIS